MSQYQTFVDDLKPGAVIYLMHQIAPLTHVIPFAISQGAPNSDLETLILATLPGNFLTLDIANMLRRNSQELALASWKLGHGEQFDEWKLMDIRRKLKCAFVSKDALTNPDADFALRYFEHCRIDIAPYASDRWLDLLHFHDELMLGASWIITKVEMSSDDLQLLQSLCAQTLPDYRVDIRPYAQNTRRFNITYSPIVHPYRLYGWEDTAAENLDVTFSGEITSHNGIYVCPETITISGATFALIPTDRPGYVNIEKYSFSQRSVPNGPFRSTAVPMACREFLDKAERKS